MCPDLDFHLPPGKMQVGMMPFFLSQFSDAVGEGQSCTEIGEGIGPGKVMFPDDLPSRHLTLDLLQLLAPERRYVALARNARLIRKAHGFPPGSRNEPWHRSHTPWNTTS